MRRLDAMGIEREHAALTASIDGVLKRLELEDAIALCEQLRSTCSMRLDALRLDATQDECEAVYDAAREEA